MRLTVNGSDLTQFVRREILVDWQFSDSPGSLSYNPPTQVELGIGPTSDLSPTNHSSPLSVHDALVSIELDNYAFTGTLKSAIRTSASVIQLNINDDVQGRLQFQSVIGEFEGTPAEIVRQILIQYGFMINANTFSACVSAQESAGLQYRYTVAIDNETTVQSALDELCKAGHMRLTIWSGTVYAIMGLPDIAANIPFTIYDSDLWGLPTERERSGSATSGGKVDWVAGSVTEPRTRTTVGEFTQDYSGLPLELLNPSGGSFLIAANSNPGRSAWELPVVSTYAAQFRPGDWLIARHGIFSGVNSNQIANVQLVGVRQESVLKSILTVEVGQWIG